MSKWCLNYESGDYEYISEDGYSYTQNDFVSNWDDSEYREEERRREEDEREEEERRQRREEELY